MEASSRDLLGYCTSGVVRMAVRGLKLYSPLALLACCRRLRPNTFASAFRSGGYLHPAQVTCDPRCEPDEPLRATGSHRLRVSI